MKQQRNTPFVSVIIPTWNRGWAIRDAVDSVLEQTYRHFELIVIDDGSTDDTPEILNRYGDRIVAFTQDNKGVSAARNLGIAMSAGQYLAFLDSDDLWLAEKLARQVEFFHSHPDAMICQTEETWIRNGVRVNPKLRHKKQTGMIFEPSLHLCLVSPSAVMVKRTLFDAVGVFDENLPACEDYDLWLRVSCKYPIHLLDEALIIKNGGHEDQLSRQPGLDKYRIASLRKLIADNLLSPEHHQAAVAVLIEKCLIYAGGCLKRGRKEEALYYTRLAKEAEAKRVKDPVRFTSPVLP